MGAVCARVRGRVWVRARKTSSTFPRKTLYNSARSHILKLTTNTNPPQTERERKMRISEPPFCEECAHYHNSEDECPEYSAPCGSYLCCIN